MRRWWWVVTCSARAPGGLMSCITFIELTCATTPPPALQQPPPLPSCRVHYFLSLAFFARSCSSCSCACLKTAKLRSTRSRSLALHPSITWGPSSAGCSGGDRRSGVQMQRLLGVHGPTRHRLLPHVWHRVPENHNNSDHFVFAEFDHYYYMNQDTRPWSQSLTGRRYSHF